MKSLQAIRHCAVVNRMRVGYQRMQRWERLIAAALAALIFVFLIVVTITANHKFETSRDALRAGCGRLNVVIAAVNRSSAGDYRLLLLAKASANSRPVAHPTVLQRHALAALDGAVNAQSWVPLTVCEKVVDHEGQHYKLAPSIPFSQRTPPREALHARP